jgi:hypothetical protein
MIYDNKDVFQSFYLFFHYQIRIFHSREFRYLTSRRIKFTHWTILTDAFKKL